jgi:isopenicillin-N N-acyltransferase like protein
VFVNALPQVPFAAAGLPVAAMVRVLLAAPDAGAAGELVRTLPHAGGQHYLIVTHDEIDAVECSPAGIVAAMPGAPRVWHTNHPLVGYVPDPAEPGDVESDVRWDAVGTAMRSVSWGRVRSRELLEAPPVCRARRGDGDVFTFAAAMVELPARGPKFWVTDGPPVPERWCPVAWEPATVDRPVQAGH